MKADSKKPDTSSDAGAFAAAVSGEQAHTSQQAFDAGAPQYDAAHNVIANNISGGAGYFAEAHHTASLNIDAVYQGVDVSADRLGSTAFGSPDIVVDGVQFNPKFYESAADSYKAGAQLVGEGAEVTAKYAGQTIIVPADQFAAAQQMHSQAVVDAYANGDLPKAHALESLKYVDHIDHAGAHSLPLSYADAQQGAHGIREGILPEYVGTDSTLFGTAGEGAMLAVSIALAASMGPQLLGDVGNVVRGRLTLQQVADRLQSSMQTQQTRTALGWAAGRGGAAAAMTALNAVDPLGAALLANLLVDTVKLSQAVHKGALSPAEFRVGLMDSAKDRIPHTALTAGSFWLIGPLGLLVPIMVRRIVSDAALQKQAVQAWHDTGQAFRAEFESRIKGAALLGAVEQHFRNAEAAAKANAAASRAISSDLAQISRFLGHPPALVAP